MRAIVLDGYGGPEVLTLREVADPVPGPDDLLVDVHHGALNRADVGQRTGGYPDPRRPKGDPSPEIPGMEYAGRVAAVGDRVTGWQVGDAVMGIEAGGCYAERVVTHQRLALPVPDGLALADAAAVPEVFITAWDALVVQGGLTSGRWALVHAGASGVGTAGIQIAKAIGANVAVTCSAGKMAACRELGADLVLERSPADWPAALRTGLAERGCTVGVDTILDVVGGAEVERNLLAVRPKGTIVQVGLMGGGKVEVNVGLLLMKRARWIGTTLRGRPLEEKAGICRRFADEVLPLFTAGLLRPVIDTRFPLGDAAAAHAHMEADANVGKILLDMR
jgi:NADPH2:quinone reductase